MGIFSKSEEKKKEQERKQEASAVFSGYISEPLGRFGAGHLVHLKLDPDREALILTNKNKKDLVEITLPYERIVSFTAEDETTLVKSGSGIGRAIAGGLLFGGAGAIVGGMSGKGKTSTAWYGTLTYKDKNGETQQLIFKEFMASGKTMSILTADFIKQVNKVVRRYADDITEL